MATFPIPASLPLPSARHWCEGTVAYLSTLSIVQSFPAIVVTEFWEASILRMAERKRPVDTPVTGSVQASSQLSIMYKLSRLSIAQLVGWENLAAVMGPSRKRPVDWLRSPRNVHPDCGDGYWRSGRIGIRQMPFKAVATAKMTVPSLFNAMPFVSWPSKEA